MPAAVAAAARAKALAKAKKKRPLRVSGRLRGNTR
jgi:hypothetical protein